MTFSASDFTSCYSDVNADSVLQTVEFTSLPADGELTLAGVPVTVGEQIAPADLSGLAYQPDPQFVGNDGFNWSASDGVDFAAEDATVSLAVEPPPTANNFTVLAAENTVLAFSTADFADNFSAPGAGESAIGPDHLPARKRRAGSGGRGGYRGPGDPGKRVVGALATRAMPIILAAIRSFGGLQRPGLLRRRQRFAAVYDVSSFTAGPDQRVEENSGPQTVTGWATAISAGTPAPTDPSLTFEVTGDTNPSLFSAGPAVDAATGDLTFTPAQDAFGTATLSLVLADGADDQNSATQQFTLTVESPPIVTGFSKAVLENGTVSFTAGDFTGHFESDDLQDTPATVEITSLPALGQLTLSGTAVSLDQTIPVAQVGNLVYHAPRRRRTRRTRSPGRRATDWSTRRRRPASRSASSPVTSRRW